MVFDNVPNHTLAPETAAVAVIEGAAPVMLREVAEHAVASLDSAHTRRQYARDIETYLTWSAAHPRHRGSISYGAIAEYKQHLRDRLKQNAGSVNRALSALRKFADEAARRGFISREAAESAKGVPGVQVRGKRAGNWLTGEQLQAMVKAPDITTMRGLRDRAIIACLGGAGLRRGEVCRLRRSAFAERDGHPALVDLVGKRNKIRTVPLFGWVSRALSAWLAIADADSELMFCQMNKFDEAAVQAGRAGAGRGSSVERRKDEGMSEESVRRTVQHYAPAAGIAFKLNAHDLRRTYAKQLRAQGAPIEQISVYLGHDSVATTQKYLGTDLDYSVEKWTVDIDIE